MSRKHRTTDLCIWNYAQFVNNAGNFAHVISLIRGLLMDSNIADKLLLINGKIIARSFPKSFNCGEKLAVPAIEAAYGQTSSSAYDDVIMHDCLC